MQKMLRVAATLVVLVGGMSLSSAKVARASDCPYHDPGDCTWCGNPHGPSCELYGCSGFTLGGDCSCKYDCDIT
jgi:hypothetical protein